MEVEESRGHLADQRVPPSSGNDAFHDDHHEGSLDSAYEDNFDCGEEAMQRRLLITRILSSPLLFCASSSPKPSSSPIPLNDQQPLRLQPLSPTSDENDTEDAISNCLDISTTETEEYDCPSSIDSLLELQPSSVKSMKDGVGRCDEDEDLKTRTSRRPWRFRNKASPKKPLESENVSVRLSVTEVLDEIVARIAAADDFEETTLASQDTDSIEGECDMLPASDVPCLSWQTRRPMSGRSISTDSGISSVDDSRLSQSSCEYAASPATTATIDSSDEAQINERSRRRSFGRDIEPPLKVLRAASTAKRCATPTSDSSRVAAVHKSSSSSSSKKDNEEMVINESSRGSNNVNNQSPLSFTAPRNGRPRLGFLQSKLVSPFPKPSIAAVSSAAVREVSCQWKDCVFVTSKDNDLADHIADAHVAPQSNKGSFVCLWESCRVFNVPSTLKHWLEQHVVKHSRSKPLKCIVDGCLQRFSTKPLLEAHVNSHFEKNSKLKNEASLKSHQLLKLAKKKRLLRQNSKMQAGRKYDFFDACAMHHIKESLFHLAEMEQASSRTLGPPPSSPSSSSSLVRETSSISSSSGESKPLDRGSSRSESAGSSATPNSANASLRRIGRRKVALTDKLKEQAATSSDSGCGSLPEKTVLESFVRALRTTPSGKRQMLISYYNPRLDETAVVQT